MYKLIISYFKSFFKLGRKNIKANGGGADERIILIKMQAIHNGKCTYNSKTLQIISIHSKLNLNNYVE